MQVEIELKYSVFSMSNQGARLEKVFDKVAFKQLIEKHMKGVDRYQMLFDTERVTLNEENTTTYFQNIWHGLPLASPLCWGVVRG